MSRFNDVYNDRLVQLFKSEEWRLIKLRLQQVNKQLQTSVNSAIENADSNKASIELGKKLGVQLAIQVSENLPSEIIGGKFSVDESLNVIGNNIENKQKESLWNKVLKNLLLKKK